MARKHRATGKKPPGGARPGAGRPKGASASLEYGEVKAVKAAGLRVPSGAPLEERQLADECLHAMTLVMRGHVDFKQAPHRLKAATAIREEICGTLKQKVEHTFEGQTDEQLKARLDTLLAKAEEPTGEGEP